MLLKDQIQANSLLINESAHTKKHNSEDVKEENKTINSNEPACPEYKQNKPEYLNSPSKDDYYYFEKDRPFDSPKERPALGISSYEASEDSKYFKHLSSSKDSKKKDLHSDEKKDNIDTDLHLGVAMKIDVNAISPEEAVRQIESLEEKLNDNEQLQDQNSEGSDN